MFSDSAERTAGDLVRFGLGFFGFLLAATGLVVSCPGCALLGVLVLVAVVGSFGV